MTTEAGPAKGAQRGPFSSITAVWLVVVGVFSFSALFVLLAYAPDLKTGADGQAHALSRSAIGYAGLNALLKADGRPVVINRSTLPRGRSEGILIATPGMDADLRRIKALGFKGPVLVVMPKWFGGPDPFHKGWVGQVMPIPLPGPDDHKADKAEPKARQDPSGEDGDEDEERRDPAVDKADVEPLIGFLSRRHGVSRPAVRALDGGFLDGQTLTSGPIDQLQTFRAPQGWTPVIVDETGAAILARNDKAPIYVLAEPDFLNTHGLKDFNRARIGVGVIDGLAAGEGPVIMDVTLNGFAKERSLLRLLFDPPFLAVTLCLFAAAVLAGYQAFVRFGAMQRSARVFALGKEALADNTAALIRLAGREHRMGGRYAALTRNMVARAVGAPRELAGQALTDFLDRLGKQKAAPGSLSALTAEAEAATDRVGVTSAAQKLYRWRLEMTRERQ